MLEKEKYYIMQEKINQVFNSVYLPEFDIPLAQTNIVEKIRYIEGKEKLIIVTNPNIDPHACCTLISNTLINETINNLQNKLKSIFPELNIEIA